MRLIIGRLNSLLPEFAGNEKAPNGCGQAVFLRFLFIESSFKRGRGKCFWGIWQKNYPSLAWNLVFTGL
jgi:hypothetical protein